MIAALFALLLQLVAGWLAAFSHPAPPVPVQPAPVVAGLPDAGPDQQQPQIPSPDAAPGSAPTVTPELQQLPVADDSGVGQLICLPGEEWQGQFGCVAVQLPEETDGRAYG